MESDDSIYLSGPFDIFDSLGGTWRINGIRIYDESYSMIDVYVDFAQPLEDESLHDDPIVIRQILARLRELGYNGPDFGPAMQDDKAIVLEAPEAFCGFAASKGWKNLAEEYVDDGGNSGNGGDGDDESPTGGIIADPASHAVFSALMRRLTGK